MKNDNIFTEKQQKIIKAPIDETLLVKGISGTGKTAIGLKRISYLRKKEKLSYNNFAFLASTNFLINNISNTFSDFDIENIKKYTFEDFAFEVLGKKLRMIEDKEKIISLYDNKIAYSKIEDIKLKIKESKLKSSLKFRDIIDKYLEYYANKILPKRDFILANVRIIKASTVREMFFNTYNDLPYEVRINKIKEKIFLKIQENAYDIIKQIIENRSVEIQKLMKKDLTLKQVRSEKCKIFGKAEKLLKMLYKADIGIVDLYFGELNLKNARARYRDFINKFAYKNIEDKELAMYLVEDTKPYLEKSAYTFDDLPALVYLHMKIFGTNLSDELKHIVIDNIHDYGEFQFYAIKTVLNSNSFTLFGDIAQSIYFHRGINNWDDFINTQFPETKVQVVDLEEVFDTSLEVTNLANRILNKFPERIKKYITLGKSKNDIPETLTIKSASNYNNVARNIAKKIREIEKTDEFKNVAIIGRDMKECRSIRKAIGNHYYEPTLIENNTSILNEKVCVIPPYLSRGIKFDYVIIPNVSNENYSNDILDIKLLYTAVNKYSKKLDIYFIKNISNLIIE